ncbi:serine/threonine-protein kinase [Streptomyces litchfieldiae]|uniref:Serine/threonine-protein kinase n=1 Tax=Streptomyces litchfieldiae TaxID=3075543 RepID=A0ABU2MY88_9ACTN|nr:serine/threonine-protein kinase [Streptomyces sp. DSM 44938]MDT0346590.1 serine/threonine-protein kinase [Streptomyces sp. DSM 44938]
MEPLRDDDPQTIGGYTLVCRIGAGGMGQVYLGESAAGQQVAVKVIKASMLDEDSRARFLLEVDSLKTVYGPFIASFVAADAHAEQPWLAVEFVPGPDLLTFVTEQGPLSLVETASLGALLAEGLGTVHEAGLLHRDLKPQNVLLAPYGPKVIDFGLAVLAERRSTLTATGVVVGSVLCMPPEQARGEHRLDRPADVYALGAVLLYAATGHYPYTGPSWQAVALRIEDPDTPPDLSDLPSELEPLISGMLALDPAGRPTLAQVTERLVHVIAGCGLTAAQAKRRLTDRTPTVIVPEAPAPPAATALLEGRTGYTPAMVDVAAREDDDVPQDQRPGAGPDDDRPDSPPDVAPDGPDVLTHRGTDAPRFGVRFSVPMRIAEQLRAAYARDARF